MSAALARVRGRFRRRYGASALHLLVLLACFGVAGYAAWQWVDQPQLLRLLIWFAGALIGHDLVLFPVYTWADRAMLHVVPLRAVNYLRVPALLSGLLFLLWWPLILGRSEAAYHAASGSTTDPYLARWLLVSGLLFAGSAVLYAWRSVRLARRARSRSGSKAN